MDITSPIPEYGDLILLIWLAKALSITDGCNSAVYEGSKTCAAVLTSHFQVRIMLIDTIFGVIYYEDRRNSARHCRICLWETMRAVELNYWKNRKANTSNANMGIIAHAKRLIHAIFKPRTVRRSKTIPTSRHTWGTRFAMQWFGTFLVVLWLRLR